MLEIRLECLQRATLSNGKEAGVEWLHLKGALGYYHKVGYLQATHAWYLPPQDVICYVLERGKYCLVRRNRGYFVTIPKGLT